MTAGTLEAYNAVLESAPAAALLVQADLEEEQVRRDEIAENVDDKVATVEFMST
jgi:hypothetical protein